MSNAVIESLEAQRAEQESFVDQLLAHATEEGRDLVPAEKANLESVSERIAAIDDQLAPLRKFESLRARSAESASRAFSGRTDETRSLGLGGGGFTYASVGAYLVDHLATLGHKNAELRDIFSARTQAALARVRGVADQDAIQRAANQITTDTPGLLPTPVVGPVLNTIDANRPLVSSLGPKSLAGIPGTSFNRPRITQHATSGKQSAEKSALPSQPMKIMPVNFPKETHGGWVNISRQDIDWTSPTAWDILVQDLADAYAVDTETTIATAFAAGTGMNGPITVDSNDLSGWAAALYEAAALVYRGCGRLPDRLWCSLDVWSKVGPITDTAKLVFPGAADGGQGDSSLRRFEGNMFELDRIVVPTFPDGTCIVGASAMAEFYEERIGLLSAIEPSILGVEVAYGGYTAFGFLEPDGFTKITAPAAPLTAKTTTTKSNGTTTS